MSEPSLDSEASTGWFGRLSETPLFEVLRRVQRQRLTGTLTVSKEDQSRRFYFQDGELRTANSSREEHRIGASLVCWGYITRQELEQALAKQRETQERLDQILVESGLITRAVMDAEARRLMEQIVFSTLSWREGDFHFLNNAGRVDPDVAISLPVTEMIMEGIRRIPESEQFLATLGDLSNIPTCVENPAVQAESPRLPPEAAYFLSRIDGKTDAHTLLKLSPDSRMAGAKILSALVYCGLVEMRRPPVEARRAAPHAHGAAPKAAQPVTPSVSVNREQHRDFVRDTYRRIDWLSHYDLLGIPTNATREEIEDAYRVRSCLVDPALRSRPDLADCGRELDVLSGRLRAARDTLLNPAAREAYGQKIQEAPSFLAEGANGRRSPAPSAKIRQWTASQNYQKAKQLIEAKDFFPAIQMLIEAVHFVPDSPEYRYVLGVALLRNPLWRDAALGHLEEAARLDPSRADIQATLAKAYLEQSSLEKALSCARMALNLASDKGPYRELERRVEEALQLAEAERKRGLLGRVFRKG